MIVLLVLVSVLALNVEPAIDWSSCGKETKCFCIGDSADPSMQSELVETKVTDTQTVEKINLKCSKVGMQNKFYGEDIALFQMQVTEEPTLKKLTLYYINNEAKEILTFGCDFSARDDPILYGSGEVDRNGKNYKDKYKINELFEKLSRFEGDNVVCAVKIEDARKLLYFLGEEAKNKNGVIKLEMETTTGGKKTWNLEKGRDFVESTDNLCNPFSFKQIPKSDSESKIIPLQNLDRNILSCEGNKFYTMKYDNSSKERIDMDKLECKKDPTDGIYYFHIHKNDVEFKVEYPETYMFFCAAPFNKLCKKPDCKPSPDTSCPTFNNETDGPATLYCPHNRWVVDEVYQELHQQPECMQDAMGEIENAEFYIQANGYNDKRTNPLCFTNYNCASHTSLVTPCADEDLCHMVEKTDTYVKCKKASAKLNVTVDDNIFWDDSAMYTCNPTTGKYENGTREIPNNARVRCLTNETYSAEKAEPIVSDTQIGAIMGGIFGLCLLVLGIGYVSFNLYQKRKSRLRVKGKGQWRKLQKSERIAHCKAAFAEIANTNLDNAENLIAGLDLIETMLDAETEDVECWEEASPFLMRLHGSIGKIDEQIWHMFSRYMYLQAKKIIDKHGWLAPKPIRNKSRKGLIRAVAVRLLSFSMFDQKASDAEELIVAGFKQLQYNAIEQYPHCGLLWALLPYTHPIATKADSRTANFNFHKFLNKLQKSAMRDVNSIPKEQQITEFGSIAYQAAFAVGAAPSFYYHDGHRNDVWICKPEGDGGSVQRGYLDGLGGNIGRNPCPILLATTCNAGNLNKNYIKLHITSTLTVEEFKEIIQKTIKIDIYYGRVMDAKRLQNRFITEKEEKVVARIKKKRAAEAAKAEAETEAKEAAAAKEANKGDDKAAAAPELDEWGNPKVDDAQDLTPLPMVPTPKVEEQKPLPMQPTPKVEEHTAPADDAPDPAPAAAPAPALKPAAAPAVAVPTPAAAKPAAAPTPAPAPIAGNKAPEAGKKDERLKSGADTPAAAAPAAVPAAPPAPTPAPNPAEAAAAAPAPAPNPAAAGAPPALQDPFGQNPDQTDPDALVNKLQHQQQDFQDALEQILESVRKWFARRTDMEEFKKPPIYPVDDKFKLDNHISKGKKTDVEGDKTPDSQDSSCERERIPEQKKPPVVPGSRAAAKAAAAAAAAPAAAPAPAAKPAAAAPVKP